RWSAGRSALGKLVVIDLGAEAAFGCEHPGELARGFELGVGPKIELVGRISTKKAHRDGVLPVIGVEKLLLGGCHGGAIISRKGASPRSCRSLIEPLEQLLHHACAGLDVPIMSLSSVNVSEVERAPPAAA